MKHKTAILRALALMAALMVFSACFAMAEEEPAAPSYDIIYSASNPIPAIAAAVRPSIVQITTSAESWDPATRVGTVEPVGYGSASFFRADTEGGSLLTNYHVVEDGDVFSALWLDGTETELELIGYDDGSDIAVLHFEGTAPSGAVPVALGDSDALQIGELAICIGNPGSGSDVLYGTVTAGIISGLQREDINANNFGHSVNVIQTDAPINSGNSGGALLNAKGELVGIPTLKMSMGYTMVYEGLSFCIPINHVKDYIEQIIERGTVVRPRMGVTVVSNDGPDEAMRKYPPAGAQVYAVEPGTPADNAGLQVRDIIVEANGERILTAADLVRAVDKVGEGEEMILKVYRYHYDMDDNIIGLYEELTITLHLELID